jgi:lysozyme
MTKIKGIDVSHWQGDIDWKKVKADGVVFAILKATQGTDTTDDKFKTNAHGASAAGVKIGAYHYGKFSNVAEAKAEVKYFLKTVSGFKLTYPLVLDLEENKKGASKTALTDAAIAFLEEIEKAGHFAMLYSGKAFFENTLDEKRLKPYALWAARYNDELGRKADVWQYSSEGKVNGIKGNVDMNWSYRDFASEIKEMSKPAVKPLKPSPKPVEKKVHTVIKGETVSKIADKNHTSVKAIDKLNPKIKDLDLIYPGQKIRVK